MEVCRYNLVFILSEILLTTFLTIVLVVMMVLQLFRVCYNHNSSIDI